ncbi:MAG: efflux RND transporter periplasmic adaptor subunit [Bacteroidota bacterium]
MKKIDRRIVIVASLIFIIGLAYGVMRYLIALKEDQPMNLPEDARRFVKVDTVQYETIWTPVSAPGRLNSLAEVELVAEASGKIKTSGIELKKGARFKQGDILFTIYPDEARLALRARKSQFMNMLANLLPDISIDYPEKEEVFRDFFSAITIDKPLPDFPEVESEKLKIFLASRNVLSEYLNIQKDELKLSRHTLLAPFNGTYQQVYLEAGAYVNTGGRVAKAIRTDKLELEVPLERIDADWVKTGDKVKVISDRSHHEWEGIVIRKNQFVDPNTQSQGVFIQLSNDNELPLLVGEFLHAEFAGHPVDHVMRMPRNAVINSNEVFVVVEGRLEKRIINVVKVNERTLLFSGLEEGEVLVIQPMVNILEGTLVRTGTEPESQTTRGNKERGRAQK